MKQEKITNDVDDKIYTLMKDIQKKYNLSLEEARDRVNHSLRLLMLSFPGEWLIK